MKPHRPFRSVGVARLHGREDRVVLFLNALEVMRRIEGNEPEAQRALDQIQQQIFEHLVSLKARQVKMKLAIEQHHLLDVALLREGFCPVEDFAEREDVLLARPLGDAAQAKSFVEQPDLDDLENLAENSCEAALC